MPMKLTTSIKDLMDEYLEAGISDPAEMAKRASRQLDAEQLFELVEGALVEAFRSAIHEFRQRSRQQGAGTARWDGAQDAYRVLMVPEFVGGEWKPLGECTPADILASANEYHRQAESNRVQGERRRKLAAAMKRAGAATVADLGAEKASAILYQ